MPSVVATLAALVALLAFAPLASATPDPVGSGTTTITLNKGFFKKVKKAGIKVLKVSPGKVSGRKVTLPVAGGSMDPTNGLGSLELSGGIKFKLGKKTAPITALVLDTAGGKLTGKVAGKKMKVASAPASGLTYARNGFGVNVNVKTLKLTGNAVKQLNKKLGFTHSKKGKQQNKRASASKAKHKPKPKTVKSPFKANQILGSSFSESQPKTVAIVAGGGAGLLTNEATVKKFRLFPPEGLGVEIVPVEPAALEPQVNPFTPLLKFPVGGGSIAPDASAGTVQTNGGIKLVQETIAGTTTMTLTNIWVDLSAKTATVEVSVESTISEKLALGNLGRSSIADLNLTGATIASDPTTRTISVQNAVATLQPVTAETLNQVFGAPYDAFEIPHPKFEAGDGLGTFSFSVQTQ